MTTTSANAGQVQVNEFARGWRVLTASFVGVGISLVSLKFYSAGIWIVPLQEAFGWTRAEIGAAGMLSTMTLVATAPFAGKLIDRFGLRIVATSSLLLFAAGLFAVSRMSGELWMYYALTMLYTFVGVASTPLAFTRAVNAWFKENRGLALGICLSSTGVAGVLLPRFLTPFVAEHGWRDGYVSLTVVVLIAVPIVWLWIRDNPPELEAEMKERSSTKNGRANLDALPGATLSQAIRTPTFWKMAALFQLIAMAVGGLIPSFIPLLQDAGFSAAKAGSYGAVVGAAVMGGRLLTGFLIDRIFAPYVTAVVFTFVAMGCATLAIGGAGYALVAAIAIGFAIGAEVDLIGYYTVRYFGLRGYGVIYGLQYGSFTLGTGVSAIGIGHIWDRTGNYDLALFISTAILLVVVALTLTLPRFTDGTNFERLEAA